jgi:CheY-like chemotaxis protein
MTKILLVEDDKSLREIYGVRLLAEGYDIISAGDGEEALAMAIKERPALIVSDVMMPKISGFDMLDILRSTTETRDIKVVMMTALSSEDQRQRGEQLGADRYLVKSQVGIEDVVRTVHEVLGDAPTSATGSPFVTPAAPAAAPSAPTAAPAAPVPTPVPVPAPTPTPVPSAAPAAPQPAPSAPTAPAPVAQQSPTEAPTSAPVDSNLPQPTAPFSTPRPISASSTNRIIEPLPSDESSNPNQIADQLAKELESDMPAAAPVNEESPAPDTNPAPVPSTPPAPASPTPELSFEETPRPDVAPAPQTPPQPPFPPTQPPTQPPAA